MNGSDIISVLNELPSSIITPVGAIVGAVFTAVFLRHDVSTKEFERIKAGQFGSVAEELLKSGAMTYSEYYKAKNFMDVAKKADVYYSANPSESREKTCDFDWIIRFYEDVGSVSDEQIQEIWAKILSGEINNPGSYSLKTLEVLKNMSKKDAEMFNKICSFSVITGNGIFVPNISTYLEKCKITYSELMYLDELGLINYSEFIECTIRVSDGGVTMFYNNDLIVLAYSITENIVKVGMLQYPLTNVGRELFRVQTSLQSNPFFQDVVNEVSKTEGIRIEMHKVVNISNNTIQYEKPDLFNN